MSSFHKALASVPAPECTAVDDWPRARRRRAAPAASPAAPRTARTRPRTSPGARRLFNLAAAVA
eukprot:7187313-Pyramimonas_sp.AAC.1